MPNHIKTRLVIVGIKDEVKSLKTTVMGETPFDFNSILPMPRELRTVTSPVQIITQEEYEEELRLVKERESPIIRTHGITQKMRDDYLSKFGYDNWYDWAINKWGTKWNCYEITTIPIIHNPENLDEFIYTITFQTAWSIPLPVILELSKMYPKLTIKVTFADENAGYNCGKITIINGEIIENLSIIPDGGGDEAMEIYFEMNPGSQEEFVKVDGKYQYVA